MNRSLLELEQRGCRICRTSRLYESAPAYVTDQPRFLNAVAWIEFDAMRPEFLLELVKDVEASMGRDKTVIRNGPRLIDLDILYMLDEDQRHCTTDAFQDSKGRQLSVPHVSISERNFVLQPLCEVDPTLLHPSLHKTNAALLDELLGLNEEQQPTGCVDISPVLPVSGNRALVLDHTIIMGILNVTPDSFSDGGLDRTSYRASGDRPTYSSAYEFDVNSAVQRAMDMGAEGAEIIDIGGISTRPGATEVPLDEEIQRTLPVVEAIRRAEIEAGTDVSERLVLSIDTSRGEVAAQCLSAGADMVNDVSAGSKDETMLGVVKDAECLFVAMHSRGTPDTMAHAPGMKDYRQESGGGGGGGVVACVAAELQERVDAASARGVRDWNLVVDPGIGFAKGLPENLELLRGFGEFRAAMGNRTSLLGSSRKGFIRKISGEDEVGQLMGTAATCVVGIGASADILRVHDVAAIHATAKLADAVYR
jgi:dihydropteroate synthase/2-amino-4-hydroxy-6-hydroxymethyldihydropteridine diphosphokinase